VCALRIGITTTFASIDRDKRYLISLTHGGAFSHLLLAVRQAEFFHSLWDDPGGAVAKEELLAVGLSPDYRHECGICDRDYMLRRGCPCCRN